MDTGSDSNPESEEFDQQELEIALYSQIHYDSGTSSETLHGNHTSLFRHVTLPFRVGVKELPSRITPIARKQPVMGGDFLAFSETISDSHITESDEKRVNEKLEYGDDATSRLSAIIKREMLEVEAESIEREKFDFRIDRCPDQDECKKVEVEVKLEVNEDRTESVASVNEASIISKKIERAGKCDKKKEKRDKKIKSEKSPGQKSEEHIPGSSDIVFEEHDDVRKIDREKDDPCSNRSQATGKECQTLSKKSYKNKEVEGKQLTNEVLFPFSLTKTRQKPKSVETVSAPVESEIKDQTPQPDEEESMKATDHSTKSLSKLDESLQLSKSESQVIKLKKKASLIKEDAAVRPRHPPVRLRRPPAVTVRYQQDSDTNTDYSDSEVSSKSTPIKTRRTQASQQSSSSSGSDSDSAPSEKEELSDCATGTTDRSADKNVCSHATAENQQMSQRKSGYEENEITNTGAEEDDNDTNDDEDTDDDDDSDDDESDSSSSSDSGEDKEAEEVAESGTEDTDSSGNIDFLSETNPDLEFNLEGGMDGLLRAPKGSADNNWKIDEKDLYNMNSIHSRYFSPRTIQCRNCKGEGHMSRDCPLPMKRPCIYCGIEGHVHQACPNAICYNCEAPGHKTADCPQPKRNWNSECDRCWMPGHEEEMCPDRWRQYHMTIDPGGLRLETVRKDVKNPLVFCFNCGKKGHLGFECRASRMNRFIIPNYPFIARYDTKKRRMEVRQAVRRGQHRRDTEPTRTERDFDGKRGHHKRSKHSKGDDRHSRHTSAHDHQEGRSNSRDKRKRRKAADSEEWPGDNRKKRKKRRRKEDNEGRSHRKTDVVKAQLQSKDMSTPGTSRESKTMSEVPGSHMSTRDARLQSPGQKREFEEGEIEDDILDDLEGHQVNDNEWWNSRDQPPKKKKKRRGKWSSSHLETDNQKGKVDSLVFRDDPPTTSVGRTWSRFHRDVDEYWDEEHWQGTLSRSQRNQGKHMQQRSPTPNYRERRRASQHFQSGENIRHSGNWRNNVSEFAQNWDDRNPSSKSRQEGQLKHSASWPVMRDPGSKRGFNRNGFQPQNDRFVAMKNSFDIMISLRK